MSLCEICHCGHDRLSHAVEPRGAVSSDRNDCLALGCECKRYVNEFDPSPKPVLKRPNHASHCKCPRCREFDAQPERTTDPWGPDFSGP